MLSVILKRSVAFTLIELIAVVAIIGILVLMIPKMVDYRGEAQQSRAKANAFIVQSAFERAKLTGIVTSAVTPGGVAAALVTANLIATSPVDVSTASTTGDWPNYKFDAAPITSE